MSTGIINNPDQLLLENGTAAIPSLVFQADPRSGFFRKSAGIIGVSVAGTEAGNISSSGMTMPIVGVTDASNAASGVVGQLLQASRLRSAASALTTDTPANVLAAALSLTAGDWDISGCVGFLGAAGTSITVLQGAISLTSATLPANDTIGVPTGGEVSVKFATAANVIGANDVCLTMPTCRVSISSTTSIYLVAQATFSVAALTVYGSLNARRRR